MSVDAIDTMVKMADVLNMSAADLQTVADLVAAGSNGVTVADFLKEAVAVCPARSLPPMSRTSGRSWRRWVIAGWVT